MLKKEKIKVKKRKKRVIKNKTDKNVLVENMINKIESNIDVYQSFIKDLLRDYLSDQSIKYIKKFLNE